MNRGRCLPYRGWCIALSSSGLWQCLPLLPQVSVVHMPACRLICKVPAPSTTCHPPVSTHRASSMPTKLPRVRRGARCDVRPAWHPLRHDGAAVAVSALPSCAVCSVMSPLVHSFLSFDNPSINGTSDEHNDLGAVTLLYPAQPSPALPCHPIPALDPLA